MHNVLFIFVLIVKILVFLFSNSKNPQVHLGDVVLQNLQPDALSLLLVALVYSVSCRSLISFTMQRYEIILTICVILQKMVAHTALFCKNQSTVTALQFIVHYPKVNFYFLNHFLGKGSAHYSNCNVVTLY